MHNSAPLIGVLAPLTGGFYFGSIIDGIAGVAQAAGAQVLAIQTNEAGFTQPDPLAAPHFAVPLGWRHIDGWVIIVDAVDEAYLWQIKRTGKPLVLISHQVAGLECPLVLPDNWRGVREAVDHLVAHGHRRIGFAGWLAQDDIRQRHAAYREALLSHGIEPDPALLFAADDNVEAGGHAAARRMLAAGLPSTAVVAATDCNAIGIMEALAAAGYALPGDQAIVGFDDIQAAAYLKPALSSIRQPFDAIGRAAAALLLDQLAGRPVPALTEVPTALVLRESCGCSRAEMAWPDAGASWQVRLAERLAASCPPPDQPAGHAAQALAAAAAITAAMAAALEGRPLADGALDQDWAALFHPKLQPDGVEQAGRELRLAGRAALGGLAAETRRAAVERLDDFVAQAARDLSRLQIRAQFGDMSYLWSLVRSQYRISMDLLRSHESDIRALDWLTWTSARIGCFGTWAGPCDQSAGAELEIAGVFQRAGGPTDLLGRRVAAASFPPPDLLGPGGAGEVVFLFPVRSKTRDWGILAVLGPVETKFATGRESFNQWAALLAVGLDQQSMLQSLREQQRDLAEAYQRERELAESLRASEERYALAARAANDGLWDWDLLRGTIYYSARWKAMLGYAEDALGPSPEEWLGRVHLADRLALEAELAAHLAGAAPTLEYEHRVISQAGDYRWMLCRALAVRDAAGRATRLVGSLTDITDRKALEERLLHDALYDILTGLPNRKLFLDRLQQAIEYARRRHTYRFAVLFLDLDGFKVINDSLGHLVGDRLLMAVAERLKTNLRVTDTAARFGGDEFAILLGDFHDIGEIPRIAERIQSQLSSPFELGDHSAVVTASIGVAISMDGYETAEEVLRDADIAMYRAKTSGKRSHAIFDMTMHQGAVSRLRTESELRRAIEQDELALHYQPIVRLDSGQVAGVEALIRWHHPSRGLLPPGEFLPIAEETGLIIPIGAWTLATACQRIAAWNDGAAGRPALTISVNLSHKQFWHPGLLDQLDAALAAAPLAEPRLLRLEITEGVIMSNPEAGQAILGQLRGRGIDLHIDDFGTGHSSLEALHRFPIQGLKLDRSFVDGLGRDQRSGEITRTIIQLGQRLGMEVIAEGIENAAQRELLRELGCAYGQGYLLAHPLSADDLAALLAAPALAR